MRIGGGFTAGWARRSAAVAGVRWGERLTWTWKGAETECLTAGETERLRIAKRLRSLE